LVDESERSRIRAQVHRLAPRADRLELSHAPRRLVSADGRQQPLESLAGRPVAAFCGIGNPAGFRHTLQRCDYRLADFREYPDHYAYQRDDVEELAQWAQQLQVDALVCTCKDLVKLGIDQLGSTPLWALSIELELLAGQPQLEARLEQLVAGANR
jgi:tetraacyldisaccharide 4'-kinase